MEFATAFRTLAWVLEELDAPGVSIRGVTVPDPLVERSQALSATVSVGVDLFEQTALSGVEVEAPEGFAVEGSQLTTDLVVTVDLTDESVGEDQFDGERRPVDVSTELEADAMTFGVPTSIGASGDHDGADSDDARPESTHEGTAADPTDGPDGEESIPDEAGGSDGDDAVGVSDGGIEADAPDGGDSDASLSGDEDEADGDSGGGDAALATVASETAAGNGELADANDEERSADDSDDTVESAPETPPHRDPASLREAYEAHDTFREMTRALDTDVTPQTVRHHMIKHGIHVPRTNRVHAAIERARNGADSGSTSADPDGESEADDATGENGSDDGEERSDDGEDEREQTDRVGDGNRPASDTRDKTGERPGGAGDEDGTRVERPPQMDGGTPRSSGTTGDIDPSAEAAVDTFEDLDPATPVSAFSTVEGLPNLTVGDVRDAVYRASTLYQTQQRLGLDRQTTTRLLRAFDLLDLVTGRLATRPDREVPRTEITARIRAAARGEPGDA